MSTAPSQEEKESRLTDTELVAYRAYVRNGLPPMAHSTQAQFFSLFLNGKTCTEIVRLNPIGFTLGAMVRARLENDWDQKLEEHRAELMAKVRERVQQVTLETVERIANELAASNKLINDRVMKYLQTGDPAELAGTSIGSVKHLKEMVEMLSTLTGQDKKTSVSGTVEHRHVAAAPVNNESQMLPVVPVGKPLPASTAAQALEVIHRNRQGGK